MANEQHLALLRQGVATWNEWRQNNREIEPDLTKADLEGANLEEANLDKVQIDRNLVSLAWQGFEVYSIH